MTKLKRERRPPRNPLVATLVSLRGNPRACVYTEPLWGISVALCLPYASVYMVALGLSDSTIGLVTSLGALSQMAFALLGGVITDKLGRRWTTAVFDAIAWVIPCVVWAVAENFWYFLVASIINGAWTVTANSWDCLLAEDAERDQITRIYSLIIMAGHLSAIFAPIASLLVAQFGLETAVRVLYVNAAVIMLGKIIWLYVWSHETARGEIRMRETAGQSWGSLLAGYRGVLGVIRRSPGSIFAIVVATLVSIVGLVNATFWPIVVNQRLGVPDVLLPYFQMLRSLLAIILLFTVIPRVTHAFNQRRALLLGFGVFAVGQLLLTFTPVPGGGPGVGTYTLLVVSLIAAGFGVAILGMLGEALVALHVDPAERARVMAVQRTIIMLATAPFGWIAGGLSDLDRALPIALTFVLLIIGVIATLIWYRPSEEVSPGETTDDNGTRKSDATSEVSTT
jgi:MFS family permease